MTQRWFLLATTTFVAVQSVAAVVETIAVEVVAEDSFGAEAISNGFAVVELVRLPSRR